MSSAVDPPHASHEPRFVVNVTAPLPPDQANPVANEVAARLNVPVATMLKLLSNRVGPVTKPVQAATAERVASILTRAGVEVDVRPHEPPSSGSQPPGQTHATPSREPEAAPVVSEPAAGQSGQAAQRIPAEATPFESETETSVPDAAHRPSVKDSSTDTAHGSVDPTPRPNVLEPAPPQATSSDASGSATQVGDQEPPAARDLEHAPAARNWPEQWSEPDRDEAEGDLGSWTAPASTPETPRSAPPTMPATTTPTTPPTTMPSNPPAAGAVTPLGTAPVRLEDDQATPSTLAEPLTEPPAEAPLAPKPAASETEGSKPAWFDDRTADPTTWQDPNPFAEADRQDRITRRWTLGVALIIALAALVTLQWVYG